MRPSHFGDAGDKLDSWGRYFECFWSVRTRLEAGLSRQHKSSLDPPHYTRDCGGTTFYGVEAAVLFSILLVPFTTSKVGARPTCITARLTLAALAVFGVNYAAYGASADEVLERIAENWRWSHYWSGKTGIDDVYAEGKKISALVFWNESQSQPIRGLCSSELSLCVAYSGVYLDPAERRIPMAAHVAPQRRLCLLLRAACEIPRTWLHSMVSEQSISDSRRDQSFFRF